MPITIHILDDEITNPRNYDHKVALWAISNMKWVELQTYVAGQAFLNAMTTHSGNDIYIIDGRFPMDPGGAIWSNGPKVVKTIQSRFPGASVTGYSGSPDDFEKQNLPVIDKGFNENDRLKLVQWIQERVAERLPPV
jgi:hypothetical protein